MWLLRATAGDQRGGIAEIVQAWRQRCEQIGKRLNLVQNGQTYTGRVIDVDPQHGLLMHVEDGGVRLFDAATTSVLP